MTLAKRDWLINTPDVSEQLTVLQWNCLADWASYPEAFPSAPVDALGWQKRKPLIVEECLRIGPDVICLQEVDRYEEFEAAFAGQYTGAFFRKGRNDSHQGRDGAAIFWRDSKFSFRSKAKYHFSELCDQPTMGQIVGSALLECKFGPAGSLVRVATSHLKAKKEFEQIRTVQSQAIVDLLSSPDLNDAGLTILCGDFNTTSDSQGMKNVQTAGFKSAYRELRCSFLGEDSEPAWTTWKIREQVKQQTIDFLFYRQQETAWQLNDVWCMPADSCFDPNVALPCAAYPSDHVALAAKFSLLDSSRIA